MVKTGIDSKKHIEIYYSFNLSLYEKNILYINNIIEILKGYNHTREDP